MATISFNGQEYDSPDSMPPEVRRLYDLAAGMLSDTNQNGVPDMLEGALTNATPVISTMTQFVVDGKTYSSLDELPPEARRRYEEALRRFDANADGVPDAFAPMLPGQPQPAAPAAKVQGSTTPHVTMVGEGRGISAAWLAAIALIVLLAGAVVYLLMR